MEQPATIEREKRGEGNGDTAFKEDVEFELRMMAKEEISGLPEI